MKGQEPSTCSTAAWSIQISKQSGIGWAIVKCKPALARTKTSQMSSYFNDYHKSKGRYTIQSILIDIVYFGRRHCND